MMMSRALSETREFWRRESSVASCMSGAMARPTRILEPMRPPMVISPALMRYTPQITMPTVTA